MESLLMASANLEKDAHSSLTSIERGLLMLKTHLEAFRRRYATDDDVRRPSRTVRLHIYVTPPCAFRPSGLRTTCASGRSRGRGSAAT